MVGSLLVRVRLALALLIVMVPNFWVGLALAQPTATDRAAAESLFDEAVKLIEAGNAAAACSKLEESQRLDPGVGTLLYLADCYQQTGRTASAWATFREAAYAANAGGQADREKTATEYADALKPKLSYVALRVDAMDTTGLEIKRDGQVVSQALWGTPVPLDPGEHRLEAFAPGKQPWSTSFVVPPTPGTTTVPVPALQNAPGAVAATPVVAPPVQQPQPGQQPPPAQPQDKPTRGSAQRVIGWVAVGLGFGGLGAAGVLSALALKDNTAANTECLPSDATQCSAEGVRLGNSAESKAKLATILAGVGGGLVVTGFILVVSAPSSSSSSSATLKVGAQVGSVTGLAVNGAW